MSIKIYDLTQENFLVELTAFDSDAIVGGGGYGRRGRGGGTVATVSVPAPAPAPAPAALNTVSIAGLSQVGGAGLVGTSIQTVSASGNGGVAAGASTAASIGPGAGGYYGVATNGSGFGLAGGNVSGNFNITGAFDRT
jgi:hypothetical protein